MTKIIEEGSISINRSSIDFYYGTDSAEVKISNTFPTAVVAKVFSKNNNVMCNPHWIFLNSADSVSILIQKRKDSKLSGIVGIKYKKCTEITNKTLEIAYKGNRSKSSHIEIKYKILTSDIWRHFHPIRDCGGELIKGMCRNVNCAKPEVLGATKYLTQYLKRHVCTIDPFEAIKPVVKEVVRKTNVSNRWNEWTCCCPAQAGEHRKDKALPRWIFLEAGEEIERIVQTTNRFSKSDNVIIEYKQCTNLGTSIDKENDRVTSKAMKMTIPIKLLSSSVWEIFSPIRNSRGELNQGQCRNEKCRAILTDSKKYLSQTLSRHRCPMDSLEALQPEYKEVERKSTQFAKTTDPAYQTLAGILDTGIWEGYQTQAFVPPTTKEDAKEDEVYEFFGPQMGGGGASTMTAVGVPADGRSTMTAVGGAPVGGSSTMTAVGGAGGFSSAKTTAPVSSPTGGRSTMTRRCERWWCVHETRPGPT